MAATEPKRKSPISPTKAESRWRVLRIRTDDDIAKATAGVIAAMEDLDYPQEDLFAARLALEEALVNALKHGNRRDPTKYVELRYRLDAEWVVVEVEDQGAGFNPQEVPDPLAPENMERTSGRGLLLMRVYTTWLQHNHGGNCVMFGRQRSADPLT